MLSITCCHPVSFLSTLHFQRVFGSAPLAFFCAGRASDLLRLTLGGNTSAWKALAQIDYWFYPVETQQRTIERAAHHTGMGWPTARRVRPPPQR